MSGMLDWLALVVTTARDASLMRATPQLLGGRWSVVLAVAVVAALSGLVGKAGLLVVNMVRLRDFGLTWLLESLRLMLAMGLQGVVLWGLGRLVVPRHAPDYVDVAHVVLLSTAPLWFSFVVIAPYIGPLLERVLFAWTLLVLWALMDLAMPGASRGESLAVVAAGWSVYFLVSRLLDPVTQWAQRGVWRRVMGRPLRRSAAELLTMAASGELAGRHLPPHHRPPSGVRQ